MKTNIYFILMAVLLCVLGLPTYAANSSTVATLTQQTMIPADGLLKADFIQQRHLTGIAKPLTSTGRLLLWNGKGLVWDTKTPFPSIILITTKGLYQLEDDKKTALVAGQQNDRVMFDTMANVLSGNIAAGIAGFNVTPLPAQHGNNRTKLVPTAAEIKTMIAAIIITGKQTISQVIIQRPNGDEDDITFHHQKIFDAASITKVTTAQERAWFDES